MQQEGNFWRERKIKFWDIIHGLPIIHSKEREIFIYKYIERNIYIYREREKEIEKERERKKEKE